MNATLTTSMFHKVRRIHMIGVGGAGMSGIAEVLHALGFSVTGSDQRLSATTERLAEVGIPVTEGHAAENVAGAHVVVYSSAVRADNVEVVAAKSHGIPVIERAEMLGELTRMRFTVGVAGTHGKTTTTSMIGHILTTAEVMPTIIVGGIAKSLGSGGILGEGRYLVVEADEYARTFLHMYPTVAVVTSLEEDHLDCYGDLDDIRSAFSQYLDRIPFYGSAVMCADHPNVEMLSANLERTIVRYGLGANADLAGRDISVDGFASEFTIAASGEDLGRVRLEVPGRHNILNALAAVAVGLELDVPFDAIRSGLESFSGVDRRFQIRGTVNGATIADDYAHHPTALRETIRTAKEVWRGGRVVVVFQPHLYSRTRDFQADFADALASADVAFVTDIYPSREAPIPGVSSDLIVNTARDRGDDSVCRVADLDDATNAARATMREGDLIMTIGAGDVHIVGRNLLSGGTA